MVKATLMSGLFRRTLMTTQVRITVFILYIKLNSKDRNGRDPHTEDSIIPKHRTTTNKNSVNSMSKLRNTFGRVRKHNSDKVRLERA